MEESKWKEMKNMDVCKADKNSLVDIRDVKIDTDLGQQERIADYIRQVKNPYCFLCDGIVVKMKFKEQGETLEERLEKYFLSL